MPFDLDTLKDKLDSATLDKLRAHVDELGTRAETAEEKARKAAKESIDGRKTLKAERDKAFEKLGISEADELDSLPDAKGQGEATKQLEAKVKALTRQLDEATQARDQLGGEIKGMKRNAALAEAIQGHKFKNPADVQVLLQSRLVEEGDQTLFKTDDGKLVPVKDGAAWFAKTRPDYIEPAGGSGGGSGFKGAGGGSGKTVTRAQLEAAQPHERGALLQGATLVEA